MVGGLAFPGALALPLAYRHKLVVRQPAARPRASNWASDQFCFAGIVVEAGILGNFRDRETKLKVARHSARLSQLACPHNESRVSCGAMKNESFLNLRVPPAANRCQAAVL